MSEYILKLRHIKDLTAPYLQELGAGLFIHVCVPHPQAAKKFANLDHVTRYLSQFPTAVQNKFVITHYPTELAQVRIEKLSRKLLNSAIPCRH